MKRELLERIIKSAFEAGERWGIAYFAWYIPSPQSHKMMLKKATANAMRIAKKARMK